MGKWKSIWGGIKKGLAVAGAFDPRIGMISDAIESVEEARPDDPGADKHATVVAMSDAFLATELAHLTPEQKQQVKDARDEMIHTEVAARNAVQKLSDLFASFKKAA